MRRRRNLAGLGVEVEVCCSLRKRRVRYVLATAAHDVAYFVVAGAGIVAEEEGHRRTLAVEDPAGSRHRIEEGEERRIRIEVVVDCVSLASLLHTVQSA